jgi:hypothetical protein
MIIDNEGMCQQLGMTVRRFILPSMANLVLRNTEAIVSSMQKADQSGSHAYAAIYRTNPFVTVEATARPYKCLYKGYGIDVGAIFSGVGSACER